MSRKSRGCNYERKLVSFLYSLGFSAVRVAGSGSSHYPSPDVIASNNKRIVAIEVKSTQKDRVYIDKRTVSRLLEFSDMFGAEPWFALHIVGKGWFFKHAGNFNGGRLDENNTYTVDSFLSHGQK